MARVRIENFSNFTPGQSFSFVGKAQPYRNHPHRSNVTSTCWGCFHLSSNKSLRYRYRSAVAFSPCNVSTRVTAHTRAAAGSPVWRVSTTKPCVLVRRLLFAPPTNARTAWQTRERAKVQLPTAHQSAPAQQNTRMFSRIQWGMPAETTHGGPLY